MKLIGLRKGDVIEANVRGLYFEATVRSVEDGQVWVDPPPGYSYRLLTARHPTCAVAPIATLSPPRGGGVSLRRVRVSQSRGTVERVPRGHVPRIDLDLGENQSIVAFETSSTEYAAGHDDRKTVDWRWTAWIATDLGEAPAT